MAMNLKQMQDIVLKPTGAEYASDAVRHINKAQCNLAVESEKIKRLNVTVNSGYFSLPAACLLVKSVYYGGYPLQQYEFDNVPDFINGSPSCWLRDELTVGAIITKIIRLHPSPESGSAAQLVYIERPAVLVKDEDVPVLEDSEEYLIAYAMWRLFAENDELAGDAAGWKIVAEQEKANWLKLNGVQNKRVRRVRTPPFR